MCKLRNLRCNQQTPAANKKMTDYQPPSYEELRVENQNLRKENAELRADNEKLTEIFETARYEFEKNNKLIERLNQRVTRLENENKALREENAALKSELKEEKAKVATLSKMLFENKTDLPAGRQGNKTKAQKGRIRKQRGAAPSETEIESFLPHKLSDEVKGKLRVAGRSDPAGSGDKSTPDQAACPVSARRPETRQAA